MKTYHKAVYNLDSDKLAPNVLKQELVTYEQVEHGLKITKFSRRFSNGEVLDEYSNSTILLEDEFGVEVD